MFYYKLGRIMLSDSDTAVYCPIGNVQDGDGSPCRRYDCPKWIPFDEFCLSGSCPMESKCDSVLKSDGTARECIYLCRACGLPHYTEEEADREHILLASLCAYGFCSL